MAAGGFAATSVWVQGCFYNAQCQDTLPSGGLQHYVDYELLKRRIRDCHAAAGSSTEAAAAVAFQSLLDAQVIKAMRWYKRCSAELERVRRWTVPNNRECERSTNELRAAMQAVHDAAVQVDATLQQLHLQPGWTGGGDAGGDHAAAVALAAQAARLQDLIQQTTRLLQVGIGRGGRKGRSAPSALVPQNAGR